MTAYPGLPPVRIFPILEPILEHDASRDRYDGRAEFYLEGAELAGNTGTYLDAPFHRFRDREDLATLPLETVVGLPGMILDSDGAERAVSLETRRSSHGYAGRDRTGPGRARTSRSRTPRLRSGGRPRSARIAPGPPV